MSKTYANVFLFLFAFTLFTPQQATAQMDWIAQWNATHNVPLAESYPKIFGQAADGSFLHPEYDEVRRLLDNYPPEFRNELLMDTWTMSALDEDFPLLTNYIAANPDIAPSRYPFEHNPTLPIEIEDIVSRQVERIPEDDAIRIARREHLSRIASQSSFDSASYIQLIWEGFNRAMVDPGPYNDGQSASPPERHPPFRLRGTFSGLKSRSPLDLVLFRLHHTAQQTTGDKWRRANSLVETDAPTEFTEEQWKKEKAPSKQTRSFTVETLDFATHVLPHLPKIVVARQTLKDATDKQKVQQRQMMDEFFIMLLANQLANASLDVWISMENAHGTYLIYADEFPGYVEDRRFVPEYSFKTQLSKTSLGSHPEITATLKAYYEGIFGDEAEEVQFGIPTGKEENVPAVAALARLDRTAAQMESIYRDEIVPLNEDESRRWRELEDLLTSPPPGAVDTESLGALNEALLSIYSGDSITRLRGKPLEAYNYFIDVDRGYEGQIVQWTNAGLWFRSPENLIVNDLDERFAQFANGEAIGGGFSGGSSQPIIAVEGRFNGPEEKKPPKITWETPDSQAARDALTHFRNLYETFVVSGTLATTPEAATDSVVSWQKNYRSNPLLANARNRRPRYVTGLDFPFSLNVRHVHIQSNNPLATTAYMPNPVRATTENIPVAGGVLNGLAKAVDDVVGPISEERKDEEQLRSWLGPYMAAIESDLPSIKTPKQVALDEFGEPIDIDPRPQERKPKLEAAQLYYALVNRIPYYWVYANPKKEKLLSDALPGNPSSDPFSPFDPIATNSLDNVLWAMNNMSFMLLDFDLDGEAATAKDIDRLLRALPGVAIRTYQ